MNTGTSHAQQLSPEEIEANEDLVAVGLPGATLHHALEPGRNDPCPCSSGKKYKRCCGQPGQRVASRPLLSQPSIDPDAEKRTYPRPGHKGKGGGHRRNRRRRL